MGTETAQIQRRLVVVELMTLAVALPAVAGAVNAAGFMVVGAYLSHVTGNLARIGDEVALGNFDAVLRYGALVAAFFLGAVFATLQIEVSKRLNRPPYFSAMLTESLFLGAFSLACALTTEQWHMGNLGLMSLISFTMGMQNAMVTRLSGAVVRTTHMTGIVTDLGIEAVRLVYVAKDATQGQPLVNRVAAMLSLRGNIEARRFRLLSYILFSFLAGAIAGPIVYIYFGYWGAIGPTLVLAALAAMDYFVGIEWHPEVHFVPAGRPANEKFLALVAAELAKNPGKAKAVLDAMRQRSESRLPVSSTQSLPSADEAASVELSSVKLPPHGEASGQTPKAE